MRRRLLVLGGAVVLAVAACSSGSHRSSPPTTVPVTSTSAVPVAGGPNPDVVPPVITVAYVNAVFAALNHINGNAARLLVDDGQFTNNVRSILRAIYNDPLYEVGCVASHIVVGEGPLNIGGVTMPSPLM